MVWSESVDHSVDPVEFPNVYTLWYPGAAEPEQRDGLTTRPVAILNDLGREGWELVSDAVTESIAFQGRRRGWSSPTSSTIGRRYVFKRPTQ